MIGPPTGYELQAGSFCIIGQSEKKRKTKKYAIQRNGK